MGDDDTREISLFRLLSLHHHQNARNQPLYKQSTHIHHLKYPATSIEMCNYFVTCRHCHTSEKINVQCPGGSTCDADVTSRVLLGDRGFGTHDCNRCMSVPVNHRRALYVFPNPNTSYQRKGLSNCTCRGFHARRWEKSQATRAKENMEALEKRNLARAKGYVRYTENSSL